MRVRALSMHAAYACAHTGACCRAGWTIPVDAATRATLDAHLAARRLTPRTGTASPFVAYDPDAPALAAFAHDAAGACVFLEEGAAPLCRIHRDVGDAALPAACRQFPRIAVIGDGWIDLTLSHACPTAAALLLDAAGPPVIVEAPACADGRVLEGLDTRGHLPPFLRHGVVHSMESWRATEAAAVGLLGGGTPTEACVQTLTRWLGRLDTWTPACGRLDAFVAETVAAGGHDGQGGSRAELPSAALGNWHLAWRAVPSARAARPPAPPPAAVARAGAHLAPWDPAVRRYLAAKVVGSWIPWLAGRGTTLGRAVEVAWHVLLVEAGRTAGGLDRNAMVQALGRADLLLAHQVEPADLVRAIEGRDGHAP